MRKRITKEDRRLVRLINHRLLKGMTWSEIGEDLGIDWRKAYNRLAYITVAAQDRTLTLIDEIVPPGEAA